MSNKFLILFVIFCFLGCAKVETRTNNTFPNTSTEKIESVAKITNSAKVIHVLVALCDNVNQGIVPVPTFLGNGEDTERNLYWGAAYGVKSYFSKSQSWQKLATIANPKENVLERVIFKNKTQNAYLIADAYRGSKMKETIHDFFSAITGEKLENVTVNNQTIQTLGSANLVAFVGHDGLMDFKLEKEIVKKDEANRDAIVLACASRNYFGEHLKKTNAKPLLWTSNLMAPEAYILHDALEGWIRGETDEQVQTRAATAYAKFQKISVKSAGKLLVTGW
ncbi:MAG TPA: hypothetical protein PKY82_09790 [Pyrinomonadaceae bacterium]|nr:hypothetical protein [Pyrinomonadaceae bacterium]